MLSAAAAVFVLLLLLLCKGGLAMSVPGASWPWILLLGIVNTGFGCWCYFSALLLHERLTPLQITGACLIIGGALFAECVHPRRRAQPPRQAA